jgi:hypothetical protein
MEASQIARSAVIAATTENRLLRWWRKRGPRITHLIVSAPRNAWWMLMHRFHPRHRYNIVRTGLPPGYYDPDTRMMHAMMTCLSEYLRAHGGADTMDEWSADLRAEAENKPVAWESLIRQAAYQEEAVAIWRWWNDTRPKERKAHEDECMRLFGDDTRLERKTPQWNADTAAHHKEEERLDEKDQEMLMRLVKIRPSLWH